MLVFKHTYFFNITEELDEDYLKYLRRRIGLSSVLSAVNASHKPEVKHLDISVDDEEGDVVAGLAAYTIDHALQIDLLWVDTTLRGAGLGTRLVSMAEDIARERGCTQARIETTEAGYYLRFGYTVTGQMSQFPSGRAIYVMHKTLVEAENAVHKDSA